MYSFLQPHVGQHRWGRYYSTVPELPVTEAGRPFRFAFADANSTMMDFVDNLELEDINVTITTTYDYDWSCDGAVLIDGDLYKIQDGISSNPVINQSTMSKAIKRRYTIMLKKISNPIGLRR